MCNGSDLNQCILVKWSLIHPLKNNLTTLVINKQFGQFLVAHWASRLVVFTDTSPQQFLLDNTELGLNCYGRALQTNNTLKTSTYEWQTGTCAYTVHDHRNIVYNICIPM